MKKLLVILGTLLVVLPVIAQTNEPVTPLPSGPFDLSLLLSLIPLLVPIVVAVLKKLLPFVPGWALPILAPALGALIDWIGALATGHAANPIVAALLGSAGVGVREIYDQVKQKIAPPKT